MRFRKLQWLFPIAVTLHNTEEAIWMPEWALRYAGRLSLEPPSAAEIRVALIVLTVAAFLATYLSHRAGPNSVWAYLLFGYIVATLANVVVPHVPASFVFHGYTPGVVTAVLINLPVMSYLAWLAVRERWVSGGKVVVFGIVVPLVLGGAILCWLL